MAKRLLAVVLAVGMVVAAFAYRSSRDPQAAAGRDRAGGGAIVCAQELGPVCEAVPDAVVEPAGVTADRLIATRRGDVDVSGWLVPGPWPAMVDEARRLAKRPALFESKARGLAATPLVAVARKGQFPADCGVRVSWRCLGDAAQQQSAFRIGGEPAGTSSGLFLRAAALSGYFGRSDYAINDVEEQPDAQAWFDNLNLRLAAAPGFGAGSLASFVLQQGSANVFLTLKAAVAGAQVNEGFEVQTPEPPVTLAVSYTATREDADPDTDAVTEALKLAGWTVGPNASTKGLPSPGVLLALRKAVK